MSSKTTAKAELILCSLNSATGDILYTFRLTYWRGILAEFLTHRVFDRNTSSTRAIPTMKMISSVWRDMFIPSYIGSTKKGMVSGPELTGLKRSLAVAAWKSAGYSACAFAYVLTKLGVAKQISGRILEPFSWVTQVATATELDNFFEQRNHEDAEPHFRDLAAKMQSQVEYANDMFSFMQRHGIKTSYYGVYQILEPGEWHVPYITKAEQNPVFGLTLEEAKRVSAARCARTSYTLQGSGRVTSVTEDIALCDRLFGGKVKHISPCGHQAEALSESVFVRNLRGFSQFRVEVESAQ